MENIFKPPTILPGKASQRRFTAPLPVNPPEENKVIKKGRDYVNFFMQQEEKLYEEQSMKPIKNEKPEHSSLSNVDSITDVTSMVDRVLASNVKSSLFEMYPNKKLKCNGNLPIFKDREDILKKLKTYKVLIIKGNTGCGKTTQVPQFIFDDALARNEHCNIVVTQPRRIAAVTVAKRVCEERGCELGTLVGYQIGLDRKFSENTRILYCTTGVLLEKVIASKKLMPFTHVILDEVHERDQDMDFLLLITKKLVNTNSRDVKVILMSATFDTTIFSEYFYTINNHQKIFPTTIMINEKSQFKVRVFYVDDFKDKIPESTGICPEEDKPLVNRKGYQTAFRLIEAFDNMDRVENRGKDSVIMGSVLIFLPGMHEIEEMHNTIKLMMKDSRGARGWKIYPLHSSITYEEQKAAFKQPTAGERKIILSTNITESSVTVADMKYVIDFCLTKSLVKDTFMNFCTLKLEWASKNSLEQRAGRVGRVSDGRVYRLITRNFYAKLDQEPVPEMRRCPLDQLILKAKLLDMGEPHAILALALDQPDMEHIEQTICQLKLIGALKVTAKGKLSASDGDLTFLGEVIAQLPMDCRLGKLIFLGYLLNVPEECIIMACSMATKPMFRNPFQQYLQAYNSKLTWADSTCSDCFAFCNAYKLWRKKSIEGQFKNSLKNDYEQKWGRERFVEIRTLKEIAMLEADVKYRLKHCGLMSRNPKTDDFDENPKQSLNKFQKALFLKLAIAGAFFPNYFLRGVAGDQIDEKEKKAVTVLNGRSPYTTVYLQGMPTNQPRLLYKKSIEKKFESVSRKANVSFDPWSKVFVDFGETNESQIRDDLCSTIPGKVDMAVYRAIKMGKHLDFKLSLLVLNPQDAHKLYDKWIERQKALPESKEDNNEDVDEWPWNKHITNPNMKYKKDLSMTITHFKSPFRFWAQSSSDKVKKKLQSLIAGMNEKKNLRKPTNELVPGKIYAGRYQEDTIFYRCRIVSEGNRFNTYNIFFVDYGNNQNDVSAEDIYEFETEFALLSGVEKLPDLAVEFRLAKVKPQNSIVRNNIEKRTYEIFKKKYENFYIDRKSSALVYSHVKDVVYVKLKIPDALCQYENVDKEIKFLNDLLVCKNLADKTDESYMSIIDHNERKKWYKLIDEGVDYVGESNQPVVKQELDLVDDLDTIDSPGPNEWSQEIYLNGPHSPLEMRVFGCTQCSVAKRVNIEQSSVNSILLDTNPTDTHERMLVSAFVGTNESGDVLTLRHTTVMPNLPGLPALVILIFSPMVELRTNSCNTKFSGALCGLGYDGKSGAPLFEEQDIELVFDVEIKLEHIRIINKIRFWLNRASCQMNFGNTMSREISEASRNLTGYLHSLFSTKFELQELHYNVTSYQWGRIPEENLMNPCSDEIAHPAADTQFVFRLIWGIRLHGRKHEEELRKEVITNILELRKFTKEQLMTAIRKSLTCKLCQVELTNPIDTKLHLKSYHHKVREARFEVPVESKSVSAASSMMSLNEPYSPMIAGPSSVNFNMRMNSGPPLNPPTNSLPLNCYPDRSYISRNSR